MKKWQIPVMVVLAALALYQWNVARTLREQMADRARLVASCQGLMPPRQELTAAAQWLHGFYQSPEGLQRPQGLAIDNRPDFEGVTAWILDTYTWARVEGLSDAEARERIVKQIQGTEEWKSKHPAGASK